jgi:hypothetical protein
MQGFVLEGYPKDKEQFKNIKNMKLNPTLIVALDASKEVCEKRMMETKKNFTTRYLINL